MDPAISSAEQAARDELSAYTLTRGDANFIHQHVVDAFGAQHVTPQSKPIGVAFALIGLFLHLERGYTGRQVQQAHMRLGRRRRQWPAFVPPTHAGDLTVIEVVQSSPGEERDQAIEDWCRAVWNAWRNSHAQVAALLSELGES
ncbi:MAG TPA: DUF5946 family protein [Candidatus Limnocylindria bacterium]|jgi:hypothetical protein